MKINITAGDCLNDILEKLYTDEVFIPFREAMIEGAYSGELFSPAFICERAQTHGVKEEEYREKMKDFLLFLDNIKDYDEVVLWFGDEPFCKENRKVVYMALEKYSYHGKVKLNIVKEETGKIINCEESCI